MKMKEFGPWGGASLAPPLDPPMSYEILGASRNLSHFVMKELIVSVVPIVSPSRNTGWFGKSFDCF